VFKDFQYHPVRLRLEVVMQDLFIGTSASIIQRRITSMLRTPPAFTLAVTRSLKAFAIHKPQHTLKCDIQSVPILRMLSLR